MERERTTSESTFAQDNPAFVIPGTFPFDSEKEEEAPEPKKKTQKKTQKKAKSKKRAKPLALVEPEPELWTSSELEQLTIAELEEVADWNKIPLKSHMRKQEIIDTILNFDG